MFLLLMLALATTLAVSFFVLHQTTKIAVAIPLNEDSYCTITTAPETNRTALLSNNSYTIDINASNISIVPNISQNVLQHEKHSSAFDLISKQNVTRQQVLAELNQEEPNYCEAAAKLGPGAIPILRTLVQSEDTLLASKAAYLVSLIQGDVEQSISVLLDAARSKSPEVRVAAAAGASNFNKVDVKDVLALLLSDKDIGVREQALKSLHKLERTISNEH